MRYIYFEVHQLSHKEGEEPNEKVLKNANALMYVPENLNSSGMWGFTHATEHFGGPNKGRLSFVHQYWIDLEVFDMEGKDWFRCQEYVKRVIFDLKFKR